MGCITKVNQFQLELPTRFKNQWLRCDIPMHNAILMQYSDSLENTFNQHCNIFLTNLMFFTFSWKSFELLTLEVFHNLVNVLGVGVAIDNVSYIWMWYWLQNFGGKLDHFFVVKRLFEYFHCVFDFWRFFSHQTTSGILHLFPNRILPVVIFLSILWFQIFLVKTLNTFDFLFLADAGFVGINQWKMLFMNFFRFLNNFLFCLLFFLF